MWIIAEYDLWWFLNFDGLTFLKTLVLQSQSDYLKYSNSKEKWMKVILAVMCTTWAVAKIRPGPKKKNLGLYGIWTHDLCDTATNWANEPTGSWSLC